MQECSTCSLDKLAAALSFLVRWYLLQPDQMTDISLRFIEALKPCGVLSIRGPRGSRVGVDEFLKEAYRIVSLDDPQMMDGSR